MILKIKRLNKENKPPSYAYPQDAALDLYSLETVTLEPGKKHVFRLGFKTEMPSGYVALIWDRSSFGVKGIKALGGVIDAGYRGEWTVTLQNLSNKDFKIVKGDSVAQALLQKVETAKIEEVEEISNTKRGEGTFGSSGR